MQLNNKSSVRLVGKDFALSRQLRGFESCTEHLFKKLESELNFQTEI